MGSRLARDGVDERTREDRAIVGEVEAAVNGVAVIIEVIVEEMAIGVERAIKIGVVKEEGEDNHSGKEIDRTEAVLQMRIGDARIVRSVPRTATWFLILEDMSNFLCSA